MRFVSLAKSMNRSGQGRGGAVQSYRLCVIAQLGRLRRRGGAANKSVLLLRRTSRTHGYIPLGYAKLADAKRRPVLHERARTHTSTIGGSFSREGKLGGTAAINGDGSNAPANPKTLDNWQRPRLRGAGIGDSVLRYFESCEEPGARADAYHRTVGGPVCVSDLPSGTRLARRSMTLPNDVSGTRIQI